MHGEDELVKRESNKDIRRNWLEGKTEKDNVVETDNAKGRKSHSYSVFPTTMLPSDTLDLVSAPLKQVRITTDSDPHPNKLSSPRDNRYSKVICNTLKLYLRVNTTFFI